MRWIKKILSRLFRKPKPKPEVKQEFHTPAQEAFTGMPSDLMWQSLLLTDSDCLVYIDQDQVLHFFTTRPFNPEKDYNILVYQD